MTSSAASGVTRADGEPVDLHDSTDLAYWRGLTVDELLGAIGDQLDPGATDEDVHMVVTESLRTVIEDVIDRADDQATCNKVDECRAKSVFLTWLAWNLDHRLLPSGVLS